MTDGGIINRSWKQISRRLSTEPDDIDWNFLDKKQFAAMNADIQQGRIDGAESMLSSLIAHGVLDIKHPKLTRALKHFSRELERMGTPVCL